MGKSSGYLEVVGYSVALKVMDKTCKCTDIQIIGFDTTSPKDSMVDLPLTVQVKFIGNIDQVQAAIGIAIKEAERYIDKSLIVTSVINRPFDQFNGLNKISKVNRVLEKFSQ